MKTDALQRGNFLMPWTRSIPPHTATNCNSTEFMLNLGQAQFVVPIPIYIREARYFLQQVKHLNNELLLVRFAKKTGKPMLTTYSIYEPLEKNNTQNIWGNYCTWNYVESTHFFRSKMSRTEFRIAARGGEVAVASRSYKR